MVERNRTAVEENWRDDPLENTPPVRGSGEFLKDRGYPNPTETRIKFDLVNVLRELTEANGFTQADIVERIARFDPNAGVSQPDVSRILRGNVKGYSEARLLMILAALGNKVSIVVEPSDGPGTISVREESLATAVAKSVTTFREMLQKKKGTRAKYKVLPKHRGREKAAPVRKAAALKRHAAR